MLIKQVKEEIINYLTSTCKIENPSFEVMSTSKLEDGDFFTNVALKYAGVTKNKPLDLAGEVKDYILHNSDLSSKLDIVVKEPGFINFYYKDIFFNNLLSLIEKEGDTFGNLYSIYNNGYKFKVFKKDYRQNFKTIIEYVSPNTNKPLHVGHLRNASLGISLESILSFSNIQVKKAIIYNDRGLHIMKSTWGYLFYAYKNDLENNNWKSLLDKWSVNKNNWKTPQEMKDKKLTKPDHFLGHWYVTAEKSDRPDKEKDWSEMLISWENSSDDYHQKIRDLWSYANKYFYEGYSITAKKFDFDFDKESINYESEIYNEGKNTILKNLDNGLFERKDDNSIIATLSKYDLPDKVLIRSDGTSIYMTFDIELTRRRTQKGADLLFWIVGNDQNLHFKQLFTIAEKLGYGDISDFTHYSYGMIDLKEGKMSSRDGTVIYADDLIDLMVSKVGKLMESRKIGKDLSKEEFNKISESVGIGAIKWTMLSVDPNTKITFDIDKSISFDGFSGPYIQYTYARTQSVLKNSPDNHISIDKLNLLNLIEDEKKVVRILAKFPEEVERATAELAPHYICHYLFSLAQAYNSFYASTKILNSDNEAFRVSLTKCTGQVLKNGLKLLGISAPDRM